MSKDNPKESQGSAEIRAELDKMVKLKAKAEADLRNVEEAEKKLQGQKKKLHVPAAEGDKKSLDRRAEINKQLWTSQMEKADLQETVRELDIKTSELNTDLAQAERSEAAERMRSRQSTVMERMRKIWSAHEVIEREIKALWNVSREDWADAHIVGIQNLSSRKWTHTWHLPEVVERLAKMANRNEPLPHGDFLKPLPELVADSQKAALFEIEWALKRDQVDAGNGQTKKEVA